MGMLFSRVWGKLFASNKEYKIIIVGLAGAGKTTMLYQFQLGKAIPTKPTIGSNMEEIQNKNIKLQVWDLGGQESLRAVWSTYFTGTHGVIFVVDSTDKKSDLTSKMELFNLLIHEDLKQSVFLVMANKQDAKDAMNPAEIAEKLSLTEIKDHEWHIQACSALSGDGLQDGLDWLTDKILHLKF